MYPSIEEFRSLKDEVRMLRESLAALPALTANPTFTASAPAGDSTRDRVWGMLCGMANSLGYEAFNDRMAMQLFNNIGRMIAVCDFVTDNATRFSEEARAAMDRKGVFNGTYTNGKVAPQSNSKPAELPSAPARPLPPEPKPMVDLGMR